MSDSAEVREVRSYSERGLVRLVKSAKATAKEQLVERHREEYETLVAEEETRLGLIRNREVRIRYSKADLENTA